MTGDRIVAAGGWVAPSEVLYDLVHLPARAEGPQLPPPPPGPRRTPLAEVQLAIGTVERLARYGYLIVHAADLADVCADVGNDCTHPGVDELTDRLIRQAFEVLRG